MKAAKWRDLSDDEVRQRARELAEEVFNLRFQLATGMAKNPSRVGQARRDLARAQTILRERMAGPVAVPRDGAAPVPVVKPAAVSEEAPKAKAGRAKKAPGKRSAVKKTAKAKKTT
jgi:large subunit ribosomal protein L29